MSMLLPRARLNLSASDWEFLQLSEKEKLHYQLLLDESKLEKRLANKFGKLHTLTATDILPSQSLLKPENFQEASASIVILVSKHAAFLSSLLFPESFFRHANCFAVGSASQVFFENIDIKSAGSENAASLLALKELQTIAGVKLCIIKGEQGLDTLEITCRERGAEVTVLNLYKRCQSTAVENQLSEIDLNTLTSVYGVSVFALEHLLDGAGEDSRAVLVEKQLIAMSERIAEAASELGFKYVVVDD